VLPISPDMRDAIHDITRWGQQFLPALSAVPATVQVEGVSRFQPQGPGPQSFRSRTRRTAWSVAFCSTSRALDRVGAMLFRRFGPFTAAQMPSAVSRA
jgi:hypothetical protein